MSEPARTPAQACAIYARYSSDAQSDQSIEDQVRLCTTLAAREGFVVAEIYADYAISGATAARPRFRQMVLDARAGRFGVVLAESLDRLSRDQEHIAGFHKQMVFAGVRVLTRAEGEISELHVGLKGTMAALFLKDLAQKTHRGIEGRVRAGHSGGGRCFGYRVRRGIGANGTPLTGALDIAPAEAAIIVRIFQDYVAGRSPRAIARELNAEGVPGPRGGRWSASLLLGSAVRETGILRNRLHAGERVWNRQRFLKDPDTGRRVARPNPRAEWILSPVPELRIVDDALWQAAQARLAAGRRLVATATPGGNRLNGARRPRWPLAGLVRCGLCEAPMTVVGSFGRLGCSSHVQRGTCTNRRTVARDAVLRRVLAGLKARMLAPALVESFAAAYVAEINAANHSRSTRAAKLQGEIARLDRQIRNLLELIKDGQGSAAMVEELRAVEARREALRTDLRAAGAAEPVPVLHPNLPALYRRRVEVLEEALQDPATAAAAAEALRVLVQAILVHPGARRGEVTLSVRGDLAAFLAASEAGAAEGCADARTAAPGGSGRVLGSLVAGTGLNLCRTDFSLGMMTKRLG